MSKIYRIKTTPGKDQNLTVNINQDFEEIELLSLKIRQEDVYPIGCANYGVIAGRVFVNGGYGLPKAKVSVFIPLKPEDEDNPVLTSYYPYKTLEDVNEDGYKYNLLPYTPSYVGHSATGTFPTREDVLKDPIAAELFEKYYKYTVTTNESGDYMIYGVPLGTHTIVLNVDLSDIGEFSMTPQDLIRIGRGTENQFNGSYFRTSNNFNELPQIVYETKIVQVNAFWGQDSTCQVGITRADFDLSNSQSNITIQPTAVFMGSIFSSETTKKVRRKCKVKSKLGQMCLLSSGPGQIIAIRQTINIDDDGYPVLEKYDLPQNGKLIDADGTWLVEVPMNLDYVYTNENGDRILSDDPKLGVPTNGKYRFKIKWQQPAGLEEENRRGYFLVPNIKEHGWTTTSEDPLLYSTETFTIQTNDPTIYINGQSGYVYRVKSKTNVTDYVVELDGNPYVGNKTDIVLNSNDVITITPTYEDDQATATWVFEKIPLAKYSLERSYAFSLSWYDYNNPLEAINCDDTFYFMKYNKVYTVSQLLDRYTSRRFTWNSLQIKNINTDDCEESINKLPVNDVQYRFVPIFILLSFFLTLMKFVLRGIIIPMHLLAFLWPVIFLIMQLVYLIQLLIYGIRKTICKIKKWIGKSCSDEPEKPKRVKYADNWFRNVKIPLLLYTEDGCERCDCKDSEIDLSGNETAAGLSQNVQDATKTGTINMSPFADFNSPDSYNVGNNMDDFTYLWAGPNVTTTFLDTPATNGNGDYPDVLFTNSLTIAERLNCFNLKDKYFDTTPVNGGVGRNQVKRTISGNGNLFHYDNTMVLVVDSSEISSFLTGQLISFSDPLLSSDPNLTGSSVTNTGGTNSITGTPIANGAQWTYNYASPTNPNVSNSVTYTINYTSETPNYLSYRTDMEYFQVLTGLTLSSFTGLTENSGNINGNYLYRTSKPDFLNRYLNNQMRAYMTLGDFLGSSTNCTNQLWRSIALAPSPLINQSSDSNIQTPLYYLDGKEGLGIIILQRGVDPHSPRVQQEIDLSRIFGWSNYGQQGLTITGQYNINIPIQSSSNGLRLPRHNQFATNSSTDTFGTIFFNSTMDFQSTFTGYTSNLLRYYSNLGSSGSGGPVTENGGLLSAVQTSSNLINNTTSCGCDTFYSLTTGWRFTNGNNSAFGYVAGEYIEGGSSCNTYISGSNTQTYCSQTVLMDVGIATSYVSNIYSESTTVNMSNPTKLVMRTDRLPSSTQVPTGNTTGNGVLLLHQNPNFTIYLFDESGAATGLGSAPEVYTFTEIETGDTPTQYANVIESLSDCTKAVPLECYVVNPDNTVSIKPCEPPPKLILNGTPTCFAWYSFNLLATNSSIFLNTAFNLQST